MATTQNGNKAITVFYSYAPKDKALRDKLATHLRLLKAQGYISDWSAQDVKPGQEVKKEINQKLLSADIILLLVSPDFIASNYCESTEVDAALQRHEAGDAWVIPILLRSVDWESSPIGELQALPYNLKPVAIWNNRDSAFTEISKNIRSLVIDLQKTKSKDTEDDGQELTEGIVIKPRRKKRNLYKTIAKANNYSIGEKIQHKIRAVNKYFSFAAANRRSKGSSSLLLYLFSILELFGLPITIFLWAGNLLVAIMAFILSLILYLMGITCKNNIIAITITLSYFVTWTSIGYFYLSKAFYLHLTSYYVLLTAVILSCLQYTVFYTRSPRRRRLPFFPKEEVS